MDRELFALIQNARRAWNLNRTRKLFDKSTGLELEYQLMLKRIGLVIFGEIILCAGLYALFLLHQDQEKGELILRSNMVAMFYANPSYHYTQSYRREFYDFGYPGPKETGRNPDPESLIIKLDPRTERNPGSEKKRWNRNQKS